MASEPRPTASEAAPPARPRAGALGRAYAALVSPKLAIALLVAVLACCLAGVTVLRGERAWTLIFATLWFNALLVVLAISSATAFFTRIWRRKASLLQAGMILFHLSFVSVLGGVVWNGLFYFHGVLRLTEGETLPNGRLDSYDEVSHGRFFEPSRLRGETTLLRLHRDYRVEGQNKRMAYEVAVEAGDARARGIVYVTQHLDFEGVRYFPLKEGYSVLVVMSGKDGRERYGAYVPLQSFRQEGDRFAYVTGSARGAAPMAFPQPPEPPRAWVLVALRPSTVAEREGEVTFEVSPLEPAAAHGGVEPPAGPAAPPRTGRVVVGARFDAGDFTLEPREIRYWVGMMVRYDPGLTLVLVSLCAGMAGMALIFAGRLRQGAARRRTS